MKKSVLLVIAFACMTIENLSGANELCVKSYYDSIETMINKLTDIEGRKINKKFELIFNRKEKLKAITRKVQQNFYNTQLNVESATLKEYKSYIRATSKLLDLIYEIEFSLLKFKTVKNADPDSLIRRSMVQGIARLISYKHNQAIGLIKYLESSNILKIMFDEVVNLKRINELLLDDLSVEVGI